MTDTTVTRHYVPAFKGIYAAFDPIALPLLRLTAGVVLMPHGCQKLFGWFGGAGFEKFTGFFDKAGWYPAAFWVALVALTELVGGFMLAVGFLTRFAAAAIAILLIVFIGSSPLPAPIRTSLDNGRPGAPVPKNVSRTFRGGVDFLRNGRLLKRLG